MYQSALAKRVGTGSSGIGFAFVLVKIKELNPEKNICMAMDLQTGDHYELGLNKRGETAWPQVGDLWVIDRSMGHWMLRLKVTDREPPVLTGDRSVMDPDLHRLMSILQSLGLIQDGTTASSVDPDVWVTPTLASGWIAFTPAVAPRYKLNRDGTVTIEGRATAPGGVTSGTTIFTLDEGYAPPMVKYDTVLVASGAAGMLSVGTDGAVKLWDFGSATVGRVLFHMRYSLDPLSS